ncbi:MAG: AAA family ATPase [Thermoguttaceae bacterium]|jgi:hypothetical protein
MRIHVLGHGGTAFALLPPAVRHEIVVDSAACSAFGVRVLSYGASFLCDTLKEAAPGHSVELFEEGSKPLESPTWVMHLQAYDVAGKGNPGSSHVRIEKKTSIAIAAHPKFKIEAGRLRSFWPTTVQSPDLNVVFFDASLDFNNMPVDNLGSSPLLVCLSASSMIENGKQQEVAKRIHEYHKAAGEETAIVLSSRTLNLMGVSMPNWVSWERFAQECAKYLVPNPQAGNDPSVIDAIADFKHVVIRFGPLAAYVQSRATGSASEDKLEYKRRLFYVVDYEDVPASRLGYISGFTSLLTVSLARKLTELKAKVFDESWLKTGLADGLARCASLEEYGYAHPTKREQLKAHFNPNWAKDLYQENAQIDEKKENTKPHEVHHVTLPWPVAGKDERWSVLSSVVQENAEKDRGLTEQHPEKMTEEAVKIGQEIVTKGLATARKVFCFPFYRFGDLTIVDRREFEDYVEVQSLLMRYMANASDDKPLSLAVFGPPGNGKSYGITSLARLANADSAEQILEVNIAQLSDIGDLVTALHRARDLGIGKQRPPLVLFDEFDASLRGRQFGWLEYFLSAMQDGKFKDASSTYSIGRAIFVFIGGVNHSFDMLHSRMRNREFIEAKGPDFVSRLRGHLDVLSISLQLDDKPCVIVRRAVLLRTFLEKHHPEIKGQTRFNIADNVVRAFLTVDDFRHGVRSMEALVRMCKVDPTENWLHAGSLPAEGQMHMHVDHHEFWNCVKKQGETERRFQ